MGTAEGSDAAGERAGGPVGGAVGQAVGDIGAYIRAQREHAKVSLRQLARTAGVSNPYLSQIERGLRTPSAEILQQIARALRISAEALYVRAADAAGIATALVPLKLNCKNRLGDPTYSSRLQETNPYRVNIVHIDAPASRDIDHHHGKAFRAGKYNIGYWAWELPELPDAWVPSFAYFDEIWAPSDFARAAIAMKSPLPVLTMPHAISFARPVGDHRAHFGLPADKFLFLFLYDLNSYSARKNPHAAIDAFRASGLAAEAAALVIKVQNAADNPEDFAALQSAVRDLPGTVLIAGTLPRAEIYQLEAACDCFVSLHRSEGFGLAVAESMYLGKPVISTDWSATAEFVNADNGCPVRCTLTTIEKTNGPYVKGQTWAEPDVAHAAEWMRRLCSDPALTARLGAAARATIETHFSPAAIGARYRRRLESIATF